MKRIAVILGLITCISISAMDEEPYKPTIPMATGEGYLSDMPTDVKGQIIMAIKVAKNLQEAVQAIRALSEANKEFNQVINDVAVITGLVEMLIAKFGGYHEAIADMLSMPGAKAYVAKNKKYLGQWEQVTTLQQATQLVLSGADPRFITKDGLCPLAIIIKSSLPRDVKTDMVRFLIAQGASMTVIDNEGKNLLIIALYAQAIDVVKLLLSYDLPVSVINAQQEGKLSTALHIAALKGLVDIVSLLLAAGADVFIKNVRRETALDNARETIRLIPHRATQATQIIKLLEQAAKDQAGKKE